MLLPPVFCSDAATWFLRRSASNFRCFWILTWVYWNSSGSSVMTFLHFIIVDDFDYSYKQVFTCFVDVGGASFDASIAV